MHICDDAGDDATFDTSEKLQINKSVKIAVVIAYPMAINSVQLFIRCIYRGLLCNPRNSVAFSAHELQYIIFENCATAEL
jgi:hypothetical protein